MSNAVPHLERAVELLWETGHPQIGEALQKEVDALADKAARLERVLYPRAVDSLEDDDGLEPIATEPIG
jgi:hypothetical protein